MLEGAVDLVKEVIKFSGRFVVELLLEWVAYRIGFVSLRLLTWGRYPPRPPRDHSETLVTIAGVIVLTGLGVLLWSVTAQLTD